MAFYELRHKIASADGVMINTTVLFANNTSSDAPYESCTLNIRFVLTLLRLAFDLFNP